MLHLLHIFRTISLVMVLCTSLLFMRPLVSQAAPAQELTLAVFVDHDRARLEQKFSPLALYLSKALPGYHVSIQLLSADEIEQRTRNHTVDFLLTNPVQYSRLKLQTGISGAVATLAQHNSGTALTKSGGVIIARAERDDITSINNLAGKRIATASTSSIGGYLAPLKEMIAAGLREPHPSLLHITGMPHETAVHAVLKGNADVGFIKTDTLEEMTSNGLLNPAQLKVINPRTSPGFPYKLSTALYPEWPFVILPHVAGDVARQAAAALFSLKEDSWGAEPDSLHGFTIPANYEPVQRLLQELHQPPFHELSSYSLLSLWQHYHWRLLSLPGVALVLLVMGTVLFRANRKLKEARALSDRLMTNLHALVDNFPFMIWFKDVNGTILAANQTFAAAAGKANASEMIGCTDFDLWPADLAYKYRTDDQAVMEKRGSISAEEAMVSGGHRSWIETYKNAVISKDGNLLGTVGFARDITYRKRIEEQLHANEVSLRDTQIMLQSILDNAGIGIVLVKERRIVWANKRHLEIFGFDNEPDAMTMLATRELYSSEEDYLRVGEAAYANIAAGSSYNAEVQMKRRNGELFWCKLFGTAVNPHDQSAGSIWIIDDISDYRHINEELLKAKETSDAASKAKGDFLANMSHEIRTPLNGLLGMAQLLEMTSLTSEQREHLNAIITSGQVLLNLLNDVLDFSKIEAQMLEVVRSDFHLHKAVSDVVYMQKTQLYRKKLRITVHIQPEIPDVVVGDELRFKQILINLLSNAIKFSDSGEISLQVTLMESAANSVLLRIVCRDNGIGMSQDILERIFSPFTQADSSTTRKYGGTGLGLVICRKLAELMGGTIRAESSVGEGSAFYLELPFGIANQQHQHVEKHGTSVHLPLHTEHPLHVLVVDDNEINRLAVSAILKKIGHHCVCAENGLDAVAEWRKGGFDVILMDLQMPVMNGEEAVNIIRTEEVGNGTHIPIVALTADVLKGTIERLLATGFDSYLGKPFLLPELVRVLKQPIN